jgi:hypothetical protein
MRTKLLRIGGLMAAALALSIAPATAGAATSGHAGPSHAARYAPAQDGAAYFEMTDVTGSRFVVKMTDQEDIDHARQLLSGATDQMPHIIGRIVKSRASYNPNWSFYLEPRSITFFDQAIEVCDATIPYVEDHLDEAGGAFLPGLYWCPWSSRLVREIPAP